MENIARLLVLCGNNVCYTILASKAVNRRLQEISRILVYVVLVRETILWPPESMQHLLSIPVSGSSGVREGRLPHVLGGEAGAADLQGVQHRRWEERLHPAAGEHLLSGHQGDVWIFCSRWVRKLDVWSRNFFGKCGQMMKDDTWSLLGHEGKLWPTFTSNH